MHERVQRVPSESARATPRLAPDIVNDVVRSAGKPLDAANRRFMEARFGRDFGNVRVHDDAKARTSLDAVNARAYAVGSHIVLGDAQGMRPSDRHTLAHELAHVIQQRGATARQALTIGDGNDSAEREADRVAHHVLGANAASGQTIAASPVGQSVQRQPKTKQAPAGRYDGMLVENARRRLALLRQYLADRDVRRARNARIDPEIKEMSDKRAQMDIKGFDAFDNIAPTPRRDIEAQRMGAINTAPLKIKVTEKQIAFYVRLQVRFEDKKHESKFGDLKSSIEKAVETTWNQHLKGGVFGGRDFVVIPDVTMVAASAKRDQTAWLITVRPTDKGTVSYPGCSLPQPDPDANPTSVTDPTCDGGVVSIPPSHVGKPDVIGHEMMHLFGFVDRYLEQTFTGKDKKQHTRLDATRETGGRKDPLGSEKGPVLVEDLSMLFDKLGVYDFERTRDLDALAQLEKEGMTVNDVMVEIARQEAIISAGGDEPPKKSFVHKITESMDEL